MTDTTRWSFYHPQRAWYRDTLPDLDALDEVYLRLDTFTDGEYDGSEFEFAVAWRELGGRPVPQLRVYDDAWEGLLRADTDHGLLAFLASWNRRGGSSDTRPPLAPDDLRTWLLRRGFVDATPYDRSAAGIPGEVDVVAVAPADFGLRFWTAPLKAGGWVAWTVHPDAGVLSEEGSDPDAALVALRARWAIS